MVRWGVLQLWDRDQSCLGVALDEGERQDPLCGRLSGNVCHATEQHERAVQMTSVCTAGGLMGDDEDLCEGGKHRTAFASGEDSRPSARRNSGPC